jgi:hypothetical protein
MTTLPATVTSWSISRAVRLDRADHLSQAEIWLEVTADDVPAPADYLRDRGTVRWDEIEALPAGFEGFWISSPADVIHLLSSNEDE